MQIIVLHNQSLLDACLQHTGSLEGLFDLALANAVSLTDELSAGQNLQVPDGIATDRDILGYYTTRGLQPATAFTEEDKQILDRKEGISIWAIHLDFIVS
ncbi:hypothetical protein [Capnocytophaga sp. oral taxon 323]|jgi:hypothetical protein|uniref:hypothetical protein n=1 Tax=Capnocytophaga sp. oral taxon 323 TaxID=1705617 RepID=UPI0006AE102E|nr:hypothetical protein [Capnocytophaga sp. oral taxon 323]ALC97827.1 hypothetical protein AM608_09355 [Capnocytophaga sp. oral taxon 323]